eukprot:COSAG05_NODE_5062_length_1274_cov_1.682553_1_plen_36_part_10
MISAISVPSNFKPVPRRNNRDNHDRRHRRCRRRRRR